MNSNSKRECLPVYGPSPVAPGNTTPWNLHYTTEDLGEVSVQGTRSQRQDLIRELAEKANNLGADIVLEAEFSTVNPQPESQYQIVDLLRKPEDSDPLYLSGRAFRVLPAAYIQAGGGFCGQKLS